MRRSRAILLATGLATVAVTLLPTDPRPISAADPKEVRFTHRAVITCPNTPIPARTTGEVKRVLREEGAAVKAGEVLAELHDPELEADLKLAEAELALAVASEKEFRAKNTESPLTASPAKEILARYGAQIKVAEARLGVVKVRVAALTVRSPIEGVVGKRNVEPGDYVRKGDAELFVVFDPSRPEAVVDLPERDIAGLAKKQKCTVRVDAYPDLTLAGEVDRLGPVAREAPRTVRVYVRVQVPKDEKPRLLPGMTAQVGFGKPE
jgi:RND family efflux transporter MFP subunit